MNPSEIGVLGGQRFQRRHRLADTGTADTFQHSVESFGAFGVSRPSKVVEVGRMSREQHGHGDRRYLPDVGTGLPFGDVRPAMQSLPSAPLILRAGGGTHRVVARVRPWAFEPSVAHLVLYNQSQLPVPADIVTWIRELRAAGYDTVRTGALGVQAGARFERLGFEVVQSLVLLEHVAVGDASKPALERAVTRLAEHDDVEASRVDVAAFGPGWAIDRVGISDVRSATPRHRARAVRVDGKIIAYVISGRDGRNAYIQRLAVLPALQHQGHGAALVADSLRWMARWRVQRALVNTHVGNVAALALYHRFGFTDLNDRLHVYERRIE